MKGTCNSADFTILANLWPTLCPVGTSSVFSNASFIFPSTTRMISGLSYSINCSMILGFFPLLSISKSSAFLKEVDKFLNHSPSCKASQYILIFIIFQLIFKLRYMVIYNVFFLKCLFMIFEKYKYLYKELGT